MHGGMPALVCRNNGAGFAGSERRASLRRGGSHVLLLMHISSSLGAERGALQKRIAAVRFDLRRGCEGANGELRLRLRAAELEGSCISGCSVGARVGGVGVVKPALLVALEPHANHVVLVHLLFVVKAVAAAGRERAESSVQGCTLPVTAQPRLCCPPFPAAQEVQQPTHMRYQAGATSQLWPSS